MIHTVKKCLQQFLKNCRGFLYWLADHNLLPIKKNRICFESSPDYADNARALFDYMVAQGYGDKYELIWLANDPKHVQEKLKGFAVYSKSSPVGTWKELTSAVVFVTHGSLHVSPNRKKQKHIMLWHGCGYKASNNPPTKKIFDAMLVPGPIFVDTKAEFFSCDKKYILPLGYPRYDLMRHTSPEGKAKFDRFVGAQKGEKVIFWMPTFRKTSSNNTYREGLIHYDYPLPALHSEKELEQLDNTCVRENVILVIKKHRNETGMQIRSDWQNIRFISDQDLEMMDVQLYELIPYTSALITDYSSIAVDYLLLDRPIGFTLDDYEQYKNARGFVFENPLEYMPGAHMYNCEDLEAFVRSVANSLDEHAQARARCMEAMHIQRESYCQTILDSCGL